MNSFIVTAPTYWKWLALGTAVVFLVWAWRDCGDRYSDARAKRFFMRWFSCAVAVAFPVFVIGRGLKCASVRGDVVHVRQAFAFEYKAYSFTDATYFDTWTRTKKGGSTRVLEIGFLDGATIELTDDCENFGQLLSYLPGRVKQRRMDERPPDSIY